MKKRATTILLVLIFTVGLLVMLYPMLSNFYNSFKQSGIGKAYQGHVQELKNSDYTSILENAREYNKKLLKKLDRYTMIDEERLEYESQLRVGDSEVMGFIEIPLIGVSLPIYHGVDEGVLQVGVGHLEGTSLPVGGESTHTVITGHTGLPSSKLLSDVTKMREGDKFVIKVLDEIYTYEVDQILVVDPDEMDALEIIKGADYATLVTCTPYGINTHRLLIRGFRVANMVVDFGLDKEIELISPIVMIVIFLILSISTLFIYRRSKQRSQN